MRNVYCVRAIGKQRERMIVLPGSQVGDHYMCSSTPDGVISFTPMVPVTTIKKEILKEQKPSRHGGVFSTPFPNQVNQPKVEPVKEQPAAPLIIPNMFPVIKPREPVESYREEDELFEDG